MNMETVMKKERFTGPPDRDQGEKGGVRSVERALQLLEAVAANNGVPKGITELAQATGLTKGTVHRLISTLASMDYVQKASGSDLYCLGIKLVGLGGIVLSRLELSEVADEDLKELAQKTGFIIHLCVLDDHRLLYLAKANCNQSIQTASYVGQRGHLHSTGVGKAICAYLPWEKTLEHLAAVGMPRKTENTITNPEEFRLELERIRERGYAVDEEENEEHVRCVAVPLFNEKGSVVAAISATSVAPYFPEERTEEVAGLVKAASAKIAQKMGYDQAYRQLYNSENEKI